MRIQHSQTYTQAQWESGARTQALAAAASLLELRRVKEFDVTVPFRFPHGRSPTIFHEELPKKKKAVVLGPVHGYGPAMNAPHYTTVPPIADLCRYPVDELAQFQGLQIRCALGGSVKITSPVDLRGLDFEQRRALLAQPAGSPLH
jgi:hypothetical protein